jgi:hypothetical protein
MDKLAHVSYLTMLFRASISSSVKCGSKSTGATSVVVVWIIQAQAGKALDQGVSPSKWLVVFIAIPQSDMNREPELCILI